MDNSESQSRLQAKLGRELGPIICNALENDRVLEIMANPDGKLWIEEFGKAPYIAGEIPPSHLQSILGTIAASINSACNRENPVVEGVLPIGGHRFAGVHHANTGTSNCAFAIRKKPTRVFSLDEYVGTGTITSEQKGIIDKAITEKWNILVVGGTGSGKTTLTNGVLSRVNDLCPDDRIFLVEDTQEIICRQKNTVQITTSDYLSSYGALKLALRFRPDRVMFGEVRDGVALDLLKAWNTGHPGGVCTLHANSSEEALERLSEMIQEKCSGDFRSLIGRSVDLCLFIQKSPSSASGRIVRDLIKVERFDKDRGEFSFSTIC
ncbi:P-type conjugative transfer ATPase TrbB [Microbulbifer aggregans]|uniref:P-type conjugative transfer ATPase TrbB n=1 Tax=Microbulbifer aggregans TaxID=1769779 RepID=UPI001CFC9A72|nr:P-type conjugative transfer ATPase TrbB [Microbulbifer aggregans]